MNHYTCDDCGTTVSEPKVVLKGVIGTSGGILLPERFQEKHFCKPACFWRWVSIYHPVEVRDLNGGELGLTGR